jgi:putative ABC transport system substrate-binding protein
MKRREFITLLGGATMAWPLAAHAQQSGNLRTIGFLGPNTHSAASEWVAALVQRLRELGWMEGRTITIEYRWAEGREERYEQAAIHSITSSASASNLSGMVSPSAFAVPRLITSSNLVGCSTGRSAGLAPWRIRLT